MFESMTSENLEDLNMENDQIEPTEFESRPSSV
jgi:hypothetical protein